MTRKMVAFMLALVALAATETSAAWRMEIESKTVSPGQTGVTLNFTFAWDLGVQAASLPLVVRSIDAGSFWTGDLPYDTMDNEGNRFTNGVAWHASVIPWAGIYRAVGVETPVFGFYCGSETPPPYDGVSPDHASIATMGISSLPAKPDGIVFVTLTFNVTQVPGQFEFDTACYSITNTKIIMSDGVGQDHGPSGTNEVVFTKGVVTITGAGILSEESEVPADYSLAQNYPNPFNANTLIELSLRETGPAKLEIYNILGQRVAVPIDGVLSAGVYSANWNGKDESGRTVPSGMYFYRLTAGEFTQIKKMVLMK